VVSFSSPAKTVTQPLLQPRELAGIARFDQLPHEIGRPGEEHASFLFRGFHAQRDREVRLAGANRPREDQILWRGPRACTTRDWSKSGFVTPICSPACRQVVSKGWVRAPRLFSLSIDVSGNAGPVPWFPATATGLA
jgi:hypothetical protein